MYEKLGYKWANTLFGCIATVMVPIPFVSLGQKLSVFIQFLRGYVIVDPLFLWAFHTSTEQVLEGRHGNSEMTVHSFHKNFFFHNFFLTSHTLDYHFFRRFTNIIRWDL